jgi:hypothetical protein
MSKRVKGLEGLMAALQRDLPKLREKALAGAKNAALATAPVVAANAPVAFEELRKSVHVESDDNGSRVIVSAPYSVAVEIGSRPHHVPLADLVAWALVKKIATPKSVYAFAKGVQLSIAKKGTAPHWYARRALPAAQRAVQVAIPRALKGEP